MASRPITSWQIEWKKVEAGIDFLLLGSKITVDGDCSHEIRRQLLLSSNHDSYDRPRQYVKKQRHQFANKGPYSQCFGLCSSYVWKYELGNKEGRTLNNQCFQTVVLEKILESPLESREINPVNLKGNLP